MSTSIETHQIGLPKTKTIYEVDTVTLNGEERTIIIAAVQQRSNNVDIITTFKKVQTKDGETRTETVKRVEYTLTQVGLGLSVQNPNDEFDEPLGVLIAEGRALSPKASLGGPVFSKGNELSLPVVELLLKDKLAQVKRSPERFIKLVSEEEKKVKASKTSTTETSKQQ